MEFDRCITLGQSAQPGPFHNATSDHVVGDELQVCSKLILAHCEPGRRPPRVHRPRPIHDRLPEDRSVLEIHCCVARHHLESHRMEREVFPLSARAAARAMATRGVPQTKLAALSRDGT